MCDLLPRIFPGLVADCYCNRCILFQELKCPLKRQIFAGTALDISPIVLQDNRTDSDHHGYSDAFHVSSHSSISYSPYTHPISFFTTHFHPPIQASSKWNGFQGVSSPPQPLGTVSPLFNLHLSPTTKPPFTRSGKASSLLMTLASNSERQIVLRCPIFQLTTYTLHAAKLATT